MKHYIQIVRAYWSDGRAQAHFKVKYRQDGDSFYHTMGREFETIEEAEKAAREFLKPRPIQIQTVVKEFGV